MQIKTVSIVGLGALGVLFAQHFTRRLPEGSLRVVADAERIARYRAEGVYCNDEPCAFTYVAADQPDTPADLALFCVKFGGLRDACRAMRHQIGENTIILSALNGITSEDIIAESFGYERILYCVAQGMDAVKVGNRMTFGRPGMLCFGEREPGVVSDRARRVADFFDSLQFPHELVTDMMHRMWGKLMLNVGVNQAVAVYEGDYGAIQREGEARSTMIAAMREVLALSRYEGVNLTEGDVTYWLDIVDSLSPGSRPSMRQDLEAGRKSEVELFSGTIVRLGEKHGVDTPVNRWLHERIVRMEQAF
jgi:2-dehydropantoate 2-reductase